MQDKRVKACPNTNCEAYKKTRYKANDEYCSKCGSPLVLVCSKCWTPLAVDDKKITICEKCQAKKDDRKHNTIEFGKKAGQAVVAVAGVAVAVVKKGPEILTAVIKKK